ncbi:unnamed protein product, partial [Closterium sp. NIES-54]
TVVTDPSFEPTATSALVAKLVDFVAACRLDYAGCLVAESESDCLPFVGGECALGTDILEDRQEDFECLAADVPHLVAMVLAHNHGRRDGILEVYRHLRRRSSPSWANIVDGMWIFRVKRPPGSPHVFKARYVARGFSQRQGVDFFYTFSPTSKMTTPTPRFLLHVAAQCDYELHSRDASWVDDLATQRSSQGYTFSLGSGSVSWWSTRSSSVFSSSCEAEIYAGAMGAQELRWLTYLLTDLGERPRSSSVLVVSVIGVGADEELAIGAGAIVVSSASVSVAAAAVVSAAADVDAAAVVSAVVVCSEIDNRVAVSCSLIWNEIKNEDVVRQDRFDNVKSSFPIVQLELLSGAVSFKVNPFCQELADTE